eukprot:GHVT01100323.1.p1 GENE.GHVT01100323.1~~GHVT01100323.1.p1  ORF type:complete len:625 (-),score=108.78 GHVT01100323.1:186-2060(-)
MTGIQNGPQVPPAHSASKNNRPNESPQLRQRGRRAGPLPESTPAGPPAHPRLCRRDGRSPREPHASRWSSPARSLAQASSGTPSPAFSSASDKCAALEPQGSVCPSPPGGSRLGGGLAPRRMTDRELNALLFATRNTVALDRRQAAVADGGTSYLSSSYSSLSMSRGSNQSSVSGMSPMNGWTTPPASIARPPPGALVAGKSRTSFAEPFTPPSRRATPSGSPFSAVSSLVFSPTNSPTSSLSLLPPPPALNLSPSCNFMTREERRNLEHLVKRHQLAPLAAAPIACPLSNLEASPKNVSPAYTAAATQTSIPPDACQASPTSPVASQAVAAAAASCFERLLTKQPAGGVPQAASSSAPLDAPQEGKPPQLATAPLPTASSQLSPSDLVKRHSQASLSTLPLPLVCAPVPPSATAPVHTPPYPADLHTSFGYEEASTTASTCPSHKPTSQPKRRHNHPESKDYCREFSPPVSGLLITDLPSFEEGHLLIPSADATIKEGKLQSKRESPATPIVGKSGSGSTRLQRQLPRCESPRQPLEEVHKQQERKHTLPKTLSNRNARQATSSSTAETTLLLSLLRMALLSSLLRLLRLLLLFKNTENLTNNIAKKTEKRGKKKSTNPAGKS